MRTFTFLSLILVFLFASPLRTYAALININTADEASLETLPSIGPTLAARIITYRETNGPFPTIEAIKNVSGIGAGTYANISALITVGTATSSSGGDTSSTATSTASSTVSLPSATYVPPPTKLSVTVQGPTSGILEVPMLFSAQALETNGKVDINARLSWSFGDGSSNTGTAVSKIYHYPGTYLVVVRASDGTTQAESQLTVVLHYASISIASVSGEGVTLANSASSTLDLSGWRMVADGGTFRIPDGMMLLPQANVLLPFNIMNLPVSFSMALFYPDGIFAASYSPPGAIASSTQPSSITTGFNEWQTVESITSTTNPVQANEEAVKAPTAASQLAAVGAVFATTSLPDASGATQSPAKGLLHSPWLLGLMGIIALAGGAFVIL